VIAAVVKRSFVQSMLHTHARTQPRFPPTKCQVTCGVTDPWITRGLQTHGFPVETRFIFLKSNVCVHEKPVSGWRHVFYLVPLESR
jgi:hypothetical protein